MTFSSIKSKIPDRAVASILFGCLCILVRRVFFSLEWAPIEAGANHFDFPDKLFTPIMTSLQTAFIALVIASVVWCIWSWCMERWWWAIVATIFASLAVFDVFFVR